MCCWKKDRLSDYRYINIVHTHFCFYAHAGHWGKTKLLSIDPLCKNDFWRENSSLIENHTAVKTEMTKLYFVKKWDFTAMCNFPIFHPRKKNYLHVLQSVHSMNVDEVVNLPNWRVEILGWFLVTADIGKIRGGSLWDICVTLALVKQAWKISF